MYSIMDDNGRDNRNTMVLNFPLFRWDAEIELTKKAIAAANKLQPKPRFFIVCGDLVDGLPGIYSHFVYDYNCSKKL